MKYILGRIKHKDGTFSPRDYISYSAWSLWKKNKDEYRRIYYENKEKFESSETIFGKRIAELLEHADKDAEYPIDIVIKGVRVVGYIDKYDPIKMHFLEYKTGHLDKDGKPPWDRVKVHKHRQLPFYSMLLKEKFGKVDNVCHLIWMETDFKNKTIEFAGHQLESSKKELYLTGKVKKFRRVIKEYERQAIKKDLLKVVKEIHKDYDKYKKDNK